MDDLIAEFRANVLQHGRLLNDSSPDDLRLESATKLLEAVGSFLISWEGLASDNHECPGGLLRDALSLLLSELGPDSQVRSTLLELVPALSKADSRQLVLDFLPWTIPVNDNEKESEAHNVLETLRGVLLDDSTALLPVMGCLSMLPLSEEDRLEAWNWALQSLPVVPETDLPVLVKMLFQNVSEAQQARSTLDAIRKEMSLVEATDDGTEIDSVALVSHVLLCSLHDEKNGEIIAGVYLEVFREMAGKHTDGWEMGLSRRGTTPREANQTLRDFLLIDIVALLVLYEHPNFKTDLETVLDMLLRSKSFPFDRLSLFLKMLCQGNQSEQPSSVLLGGIVPSLLSLGIYLLLTPVRDDELTNVTAILNKSQEFVLELHRTLDRERQEDLIYCLLNLSEDSCVHQTKKVGKRGLGEEHVKNEQESRKLQGLKVTFLAVNRILQELASSCRSTVARFKHILIERLTATDSPAETIGQYTSIQQHCQLLASLVEPVHADSAGGTGIDALEPMMLLQKLLFSSPCRQQQCMSEGNATNNADRVIRGLLLATELVRSPYCSHGDKDCIQQWVLRILVPPNGRTIDPEIGPFGLRFLSAWSQWENNVRSSEGVGTSPTCDVGDGIIFKHVKAILARTGLVQIRSQYEQRRSVADVVLGYTVVPGYCGCDNACKNGKRPAGLADQSRPTKRKAREMVFCTTSFLRNSGVPHPSRWVQSVTWIYRLVDTYLTLGRKLATNNFEARNGSKRNKRCWVPDGWLQAAIEFPALRISIGETGNGKKGSYVNHIRDELGKYEVSYRSSNEVYFEERCVATSLLRMKTLAEVQSQVESISRLSLVHLLGIGLSFAVLENAYRHYAYLYLDSGERSCSDADTAETSCDDVRRDLLVLMKCQLMKIYDLRGKCRYCGYLLRTFKAALTKLRKNGNMACYFESSRKSEEDIGIDSDSEIVNARRHLDVDICAAANKLITDIELVSQQIGDTLFSQFASTDFCNASVLWECLMDPKDDERLLANFSSSKLNHPHPSPKHLNSLHARYTTNLRQHLVDHLVVLIRRRFVLPESISQLNCVTGGSDCAPDSYPRPSAIGTLSTLWPNNTRTAMSAQKLGFKHCIDMLSGLLSLLPMLQRAALTQKGVAAVDEHGCELARLTFNSSSALAFSYITLTQSILIYVCETPLPGNCSVDTSLSDEHDEEERNARQIGARPPAELLLLWDSNMVSEVMQFRPGARSDILPNVSKSLLSHLQTCEDANIAIGLVDLISMLAMNGNQEFLDLALEANWRVLHTVYTSKPTSGSNTEPNEHTLSSCSHLPFIFLTAVKALLRSSGETGDRRRKMGPTQKALRGTLLKSAYCASRDFKQHSLLRHNLLTLWGLMVLSRASWRQPAEYLSKLTNALASLLHDIGGKSTKRLDFESAVNDNRVTRTTRPETRSRDHVAVRSKRARRPFVSVIPSLTGASFVVYFELLFHISLSLFASSSPTVCASKEISRSRLGSSGVAEGESPYGHLGALIEINCRLVDLYLTKFKAFPRRVTSTVLTACSHFLSVTLYHVHSCVQWRNSQPLLSLEAKKAGVHDRGSIVHLQQLLDSSSTGARKVLCICEFIRCQAAQSKTQAERASVDDNSRVASELDLSGESWVFGSHHRRVTSLALAAEEVLDALREVAYSHNLSAPRSRHLKAGRSRKRGNYQEDKGFHNSETLSDLDHNTDEQRRRKRRLIPLLVKQSDGDESSVSSRTSESTGNRRVGFTGAAQNTIPRNPGIGYEEQEEHSNRKSLFAEMCSTDSDSSTSFGIVGEWEQSDEDSSGSLELEAHNEFDRA